MIYSSNMVFILANKAYKNKAIHDCQMADYHMVARCDIVGSKICACTVDMYLPHNRKLLMQNKEQIIFSLGVKQHFGVNQCLRVAPKLLYTHFLFFLNFCTFLLIFHLWWKKMLIPPKRRFWPANGVQRLNTKCRVRSLIGVL